MGKKHAHIFLFVIAGLLVLGFAIRLVADYILYNPMETSFPFYAYAMERSVEFLLPALAALVVGLIIKQKNRKGDLK